MLYNGFYTLMSPSGNHRTFRVRTRDDDDRLAGKRTIGLLIGSDNESSYKDFGFVSDAGVINVWVKMRGTSDGSFFVSCSKILQDLAEHGKQSTYVAKGWRVELDKRCMRCNRRLTNPVSLESGIGPECASRKGVTQ